MSILLAMEEDIPCTSKLLAMEGGTPCTSILLAVEMDTSYTSCWRWKRINLVPLQTTSDGVTHATWLMMLKHYIRNTGMRGKS
jgi:hypothetical protein